MTDFRRLLQALAENDVAHVVIGGLAIGLHGSAYRTEDVDIVYARDRANVVKLVAAIKPFKPRLRVRNEPHGVPFLFDVQSVLSGANFTMMTEIGDIDILATVAGLGDYDAVLKHTEHIAVISESKPTPVLSLEGLILSKRAANRAKDLVVLPELESMRELRLIEQNAPNGD